MLYHTEAARLNYLVPIQVSHNTETIGRSIQMQNKMQSTKRIFIFVQCVFSLLWWLTGNKLNLLVAPELQPSAE